MVPAPREPGRYRVAMVCLGNICRSPMADVVLRAKLAQAGLDDRVEVQSCGTGGWHVGEPMDRRAAATLREAGYDGSAHRAQQFTAAWLDHHDLVLAMDTDNLAAVGGRSDRVMLLRDLDPDGPGEVPDPYYGGESGFTEVLAMVERCCDALVHDVAPLVR
ncbi:low molecular weight protein-tyrosine-phosphatase [Nocardioides rubriscoriae]|uniref:low molecular weight protein-tyrosine-phosphatase n=1 Tax=Nocardioides rubriscoriae TaxID=642762 RepID=UPI0011DF68F5|nr:low molecular weight protein-tyrosine-phosphatase [Nocardioides rubriscoriae]